MTIKERIARWRKDRNDDVDAAELRDQLTRVLALVEAAKAMRESSLGHEAYDYIRVETALAAMEAAGDIEPTTQPK